jgi:hypothetical protein
VRADGTLIVGGVWTCYAEMTVAQAELRSGRAPIVLGAFTFRRGWPCRVDGAALRTAHRCATATPTGRAVAEALIEAARRKAAAAVRAEAQEIAADENDRAEEKQVVHDMETLRAG